MDTQVFWNVIGNYNKQTWIIQIILLIFILAMIVLSYMQKVKWAAKFSLGIANLFIGIGFFVWYGTEPIQKYFALPLYLFCGILFLYESWHNKDDTIKKPNIIQALLLLFYIFYPFVSMLLGNTFPQMVTYIMPCPNLKKRDRICSCIIQLYNEISFFLLVIIPIKEYNNIQIGGF